jgi:hypothetical protein
MKKKKKKKTEKQKISPVQSSAVKCHTLPIASSRPRRHY